VNKQKINRPLRTKLLIAFLIIAVLPVVFLGYMAVGEIHTAITDNVLQQNLEIARLISNELDQLIKNSQNILETLIKNPNLKKMEFDKGADLLKNLVENFSTFKAIYVISDKKKFLTVKKEEYGTITSNSSKEIKKITDIWHMVYFFGEMHGYISPVYYDSESSAPYLYLGYKIRNELYQPVGIIIAKLDLKAIIWSIIKPIKLGETGVAYIVDENSRILAHSSKNTEIGRLLSNNNIVNKVLHGKEGKTEFSDELSDESYLTAFYPIGNIKNNKKSSFKLSLKHFLTVNWGVIVEQNTKEAYKRVFTLGKRVFFVVVICIIIATIISLLIAHSLTAPLKLLVTGAQNIAKGELGKPLKIKSTDEIGMLANQFDSMRIDLQKKIDEMETLIEVSKDISSVLDYKQLLKRILDKNIQVLDADTGSIMLFDDETSELLIEASHGLSSDIVKNTRVSSGQGIVGWVVRTKRELIIYDAKKEPGFAELKGRKVEDGCLMSVPLIAKNNVLGVINVRKKTPYSFDEKDLAMFRALSIHAAIAIDNAKLYRLAITDGMTKLYIHRYFQQRLETEIDISEENNRTFSLIMTDIDHFKSFNDTYGHQIGDQVLKTVARLLENSVRDVDIVARYGGEEFIVICPGIGKDEASVPAERIRNSIETYEFFVDGKRVPITISLGVSQYREDSIDKKMLIECADIALYHAKESGRNKVVKYSKALKSNEETDEG